MCGEARARQRLLEAGLDPDSELGQSLLIFRQQLSSELRQLLIDSIAND